MPQNKGQFKKKNFFILFPLIFFMKVNIYDLPVSTWLLR
jgi:hypothetical protein